MEKFVGLGRDHVEQYHRRTGNAAFLHIRRKKVPAKEEEGKEGKDEIPEKVSKMAIGVPGGFDVGKKKFDYEYTYQVAVLPEFKYYPIGAFVVKHLKSGMNGATTCLVRFQIPLSFPWPSR